MTPVAVSGPALVTVIVQLTSLPNEYGPALGTFVTDRSVWRMRATALESGPTYGPSAFPVAPRASSASTPAVLVWAKVPVVPTVSSEACGVASKVMVMFAPGFSG